VHVAADIEESVGGREMLERLAARHRGLTYGWTPDREGDSWLWLATQLRLAQDYLRYLDPRYDAAPQLRLRAEARTPVMLLGAIKVAGLRTGPGRTLVGRLLRSAESGVPRNQAIERFIAEHAPDVVILTPLVDLGSPQLDHLKSARALGIRTVLSVGSWDHLSSKALIRVLPDRITVWNETQKREAVELHGVPPDRVIVTGAQCFDQWFGRAPSRSREEFCRQMGLPVDRPYLLWLCSSLFRGSKPEAAMVERWVAAVRASGDSRLAEAGILIRPHPARMEEWRRADLSRLDRVSFRGGNPVDPVAKDDYFDALYYAGAVAGLNTTALLEAGIVGRPVHTIVVEDYWQNQEGVLHWRYLLDVEGGLVHVARSFEEHLEQLARALADPSAATVRNRRFVEAFVRPRGLDFPATPIFVEAIETMAAGAPPPAVGTPLDGWLARPLLYPLLWFRELRSDVRLFRKRTRRNVRRGLHQSKRGLRQAIKRVVLKRLRAEPQAVVLPKAERARQRAQNLFESLEEVEETKEALTRLARSGRSILVGPWLSEAGFELLYWIPFLRWAKAFANLRDDRLVVVSRGGAASWYRDLSNQYDDVFDFFTPEEFRSRNDERITEQGGQKHMAITAFDRDILDRVTRARGLSQVEVLHPSLMYNLFRVFWRLEASVGLVQGFTQHRRLPAPPLGDLAPHLPADYVAVKFYTNNSFPGTPANRAFIARYVRELAERHHVVLLNTGVRFDEHDDLAPAARERIHGIERLMTPRNNLDVQTRVIGSARAFIGTYGGFSYLAPLTGIDTLSFFSDASGFRVDHLEIAKRVFTELRAGAFVVLDVREIDVLRVGLGAPGGEAEVRAPAAAGRAES
jgi:hypothetical protein